MACCHVNRAGRETAKRCVVLRDKRPDAYHVGTKADQVLDVLNNGFQALEWCAYHNAGTYLIAQFFKPVKALQTVPGCHSAGMQQTVQPLVVRLVAQEITVGASLTPQGISFAWMLAQ